MGLWSVFNCLDGCTSQSAGQQNKPSLPAGLCCAGAVTATRAPACARGGVSSSRSSSDVIPRPASGAEGPPGETAAGLSKWLGSGGGGGGESAPGKGDSARDGSSGERGRAVAAAVEKEEADEEEEEVTVALVGAGVWRTASVVVVVVAVAVAAGGGAPLKGAAALAGEPK